MNNKKAVCYIVAAGEWYGYTFLPQKEDCVIAVDGGYDTLYEMNIIPNYVIGDFDSIQTPITQGKTIRLNPIKDDTDTLYAINFAKEKGYKNIVIIGGTGGSRISHTIANVQTLSCYPELNIILIDRKEALFLLTNGKVKFSDKCKGYISVFSISDTSIGVTEQGLKYEIKGYEMQNSYPIGVSNEFIGQESFIEVERGTLLIIMSYEQLHLIKKLNKFSIK